MSRRALAYIVLSVGLLALLITFRAPLIAWFTGRPLTAEEPREQTVQVTANGEVCEALPDDAVAPLRESFGAYEEVRSLLASDQVDGLTPRAERLAALLHDARGAVPRGSRVLAGRLDEAEDAAGRLQAARTLKDARSSFASLSQGLTGVAACEPRLAEGWHLFECVMTPGFNRWMQRSDQIRNPYKGKAMLACGTPADWPALETTASTGAAAEAISHWTCPMHPSVRQSGPGKCPLCGMDLVPVERRPQ